MRYALQTIFAAEVLQFDMWKRDSAAILLSSLS